MDHLGHVKHVKFHEFSNCECMYVYVWFTDAVTSSTKPGDAITSGIRFITFHATFMLLVIISRDKMENT